MIDHSHNDFKYKLSNGDSDIKLEPTVANINSGELAEDSYMTDNNYERLAYFLGFYDDSDNTKGDGNKLIQRIGTSNMAAFVASLNRNCYIGAINFIMTIILSRNPKSRFVFISNYEYKNGGVKSYAPLIDAQQMLAESWAFPICEIYKYLGFSNHIIPHTKEYFENLYKDTPEAQIPTYVKNYINSNVDTNAFRVYNHDAVHPHSDISGDANTIYAGIITEFIKTCR